MIYYETAHQINWHCPFCQYTCMLFKLLQMNCSHDTEQESEVQKIHNHRKPSTHRVKVHFLNQQLKTTPVKNLSWLTKTCYTPICQRIKQKINTGIPVFLVGSGILVECPYRVPTNRHCGHKHQHFSFNRYPPPHPTPNVTQYMPQTTLPTPSSIYHHDLWLSQPSVTSIGWQN